MDSKEEKPLIPLMDWIDQLLNKNERKRTVTMMGFDDEEDGDPFLGCVVCGKMSGQLFGTPDGFKCIQCRYPGPDVNHEIGFKAASKAQEPVEDPGPIPEID